MRQRYPLFPLFFKILLKVLDEGIGQEKEIKGIRDTHGKEVKLSLFADEMIQFARDSKIVLENIYKQ